MTFWQKARDESKRLTSLVARLVAPGGRQNREAAKRELIGQGRMAGFYLISRGPDPHVAEILGEVGGLRAVFYLRRCLADPRPGVQRKAAEALVRIGERCQAGVVREAVAVRLALRFTLPRLRRLAQPSTQEAKCVTRAFQDAVERVAESLAPRPHLSFPADAFPIPASDATADAGILPITADAPKAKDC